MTPQPWKGLEPGAAERAQGATAGIGRVRRRASCWSWGFGALERRGEFPGERAGWVQRLRDPGGNPGGFCKGVERRKVLPGAAWAANPLAAQAERGKAAPGLAVAEEAQGAAIGTGLAGCGGWGFRVAGLLAQGIGSS